MLLEDLQLRFRLAGISDQLLNGTHFSGVLAGCESTNYVILILNSLLTEWVSPGFQVPEFDDVVNLLNLFIDQG